MATAYVRNSSSEIALENSIKPVLSNMDDLSSELDSLKEELAKIDNSVIIAALEKDMKRYKRFQMKKRRKTYDRFHKAGY